MTEAWSGRLIRHGGDGFGKVYDLTKEVTVIGRDIDTDIVSESSSASRRHAQIRRDGESYTLEDLGSANGTFLNGELVREARALHRHDLIVVADLSLYFDLSEQTVVQAPEGASDRGLQVDTRTAEVRVDGRLLSLAPKEYLALVELYRSQGAVVTKSQLAAEVWPELDGQVADDSIEQIISRLRRKIEVEPGTPRYLITLRGLGYRLLI